MVLLAGHVHECQQVQLRIPGGWICCGGCRSASMGKICRRFCQNQQNGNLCELLTVLLLFYFAVVHVIASIV